MADYLDGTVDEVKEAIREAENPDYADLLEAEKEGKDRKTVKEFLEKRVDEQEEDDEDIEEEVEEELVEEIEEETEGGLLGSFTRGQLLGGGVMLGVIIGLLAGAFAVPMNDGVSQAQAEQKATTLLTANGQLSSDQLSIDTEKRSGMYYMNVTAQVEGVNGTMTQQSQAYYMSSSGEMLFPEVVRTPFGTQTVAIDIDQAIQRSQQSRPPVNETGNQTQ